MPTGPSNAEKGDASNVQPSGDGTASQGIQVTAITALRTAAAMVPPAAGVVTTSDGQPPSTVVVPPPPPPTSERYQAGVTPAEVSDEQLSQLPENIYVLARFMAQSTNAALTNSITNGNAAMDHRFAEHTQTLHTDMKTRFVLQPEIAELERRVQALEMDITHAPQDRLRINDAARATPATIRDMSSQLNDGGSGGRGVSGDIRYIWGTRCKRRSQCGSAR